MYPEPLFHLFDEGINLYLLAYFAGFFPALALALWLAREREIPYTLVLDVWLICIVAILVATPLVVAFGTPLDSAVPLNWSVAQVGMVMLGLGIYLGLRLVQSAPVYIGGEDIFAPSAALYVVFARLGCFSAGCCHGAPAFNLPFAVIFDHPASASLYKGIPIHPTQLYEGAGALAILVFLLAVRNHPKFRGALIWVFLIAYSLLRFVVEFYRGDPRPMVGALSLSQIGSIALIIVGGAALTCFYAGVFSRWSARAGIKLDNRKLNAN